MKSQILEAILGCVRLSVLPLVLPLGAVFMFIGMIAAPIYFRRIGMRNAVRMWERNQQPLWCRLCSASPKPHQYYDRKYGMWRKAGLP